MKLILGTANFGTQYGIANDTKKISLNEINKILTLSKNKVKYLDTASNYKNAEKIIGSNANKKNFKIITKLPEIGNKISSIDNFVLKSSKNLKSKQLHTVMVHSINDLRSKNLIKILSSLNRLKKQKKIKKIGVSVYSENNLLKIIDSSPIDIVQLPASIFDTRFLKKKILNRLKKKKIKIFVRSIFLQGVIFLTDYKLQQKFKKLSKQIIKFKNDFNENKTNMIRYCVNFLYSFKEIDGIIFGVNSAENLRDIFNCKLSKNLKFDKNKYSIKNKKMLIPYNWHKIK